MNIKVYQIYYKKEQRKFLDSAFIPFDNCSNLKPEWAEYHCFENIYSKMKDSDDGWYGAVSWKFGQKTGLTGKDFLQSIQATQGEYDVYFVNPFPQEVSMYWNVWLQGEKYHPGILKFTQELLDQAGYGIRIHDIFNDSTTGAFCNYWVGNYYFWQRYMEFTKPLVHLIRNELNPEQKRFIQSMADKNIKLNYIAFIMERMFSTLISQDAKIKAKPLLNYAGGCSEVYQDNLIFFNQCDKLKLEARQNSNSMSYYQNYASLLAEYVKYKKGYFDLYKKVEKFLKAKKVLSSIFKK